jgi:hypothetical protein
MERGYWFFEANDTCPPLVDIDALGNLRELLRNSPLNGAPVDSTDLQGNYLAPALPHVLKKPVRMLLTLHPTNDAPRPVSMGQSQRYRLGAILCDPVVVVLIGFAHVSPWPKELTTSQDSFQVQGESHS